MLSDFEEGFEEALHVSRTGLGIGKERHVCPVCLAINYAKPQVKPALTSAAAGTISGRALTRALRASGVRIDRASVQKHRNEGHTP